MACFYILSLAALAITITQAVPFSPYGNFGFQPFGGAFAGGHGPNTGYKKEPLTLTCYKSFLAGKDHPDIVEAVAVTIKERQNPFGNIHPSLIAYAGGSSGLHGPGGLKASIDVFSKYGGEVSIAFTEKARPEKGCKAEDFGDFFTPRKGHGSFAGPFGGGSIALGGGYGPGLNTGYGGYGGFGAGGGFGGYGAGGGFGAFGGGVGFGNVPHGGGYGDDKLAPGVIATVRLAPGTGSTINIDNLKDFTSLKELAGRGLVVCPTKKIDKDFHSAKCEGEILSCCSLHYDMGKQVIDFGQPYEYK